MKIEKKKITGSSRLPSATKAGIATMLGLSALYMSACNETSNGPVFEPTEGKNSSGSSNPETDIKSSSNQIVDIPLSHEAISSSVVEALSSAANALLSSSVPESSAAESKSSAVEPASSAAEPKSSAVEPSSSAANPASSAAAPLSSSPQESVMSSSQAEAASSSSEQLVPSSSSQTGEYPQPYTPGNPRCTTDSAGVRVIMCYDESHGMMGSMVSTFGIEEMPI